MKEGLNSFLEFLEVINKPLSWEIWNYPRYATLEGRKFCQWSSRWHLNYWAL